MPNADGVLLGPGPIAKAVARPYNTTTLWENGQLCSKDGKIWKFISTDLETGESWNPAHWAETKISEIVENLQTQIDQLDPEQGVAIFSDVSFTINTNQWVASDNIYYFNYANALIKAQSGIDVFYDDSFRTALTGDIRVIKYTGYAQFRTTSLPVETLTGTMRIIDSIAGVVPTSKGGTGAVTVKGARTNLNVSIKPIPIHLSNVSSIPQTISDADINQYMIPQNIRFSNPPALPKGVNCYTADGSVTLNFTGITDGSITGTTDIDFELVDPRRVQDGGSGQEQEQVAADYVQISAQTLTVQQQTQARSNIDAASATEVGTVPSGKTVQSQITELNGKFTDMFITEVAECPAFEVSAGTAGTYITEKIVSLTEHDGYKLVSASLSTNNDDNKVIAVVRHYLTSTGLPRVAFSLYRGTASSTSIVSGRIKARGLFIRDDILDFN